MSGASIGWVEFLLAVAIGAGGGWVLGRMPLHTELAQPTATHATERAAAASAAAQAMLEAQTRGDLLSAGLLQQQTYIDRLKQEKTHAIVQATTGSACLREPALRLLNSAPGLSVAGLPQTPSGPAAAGRATASDTDLTSWAIDAGAAYETCRARLDALIDFITRPAIHATAPTAAP